jgi:hypothetical protein
MRKMRDPLPKAYNYVETYTMVYHGILFEIKKIKVRITIELTSKTRTT